MTLARASSSRPRSDQFVTQQGCQTVKQVIIAISADLNALQIQQDACFTHYDMNHSEFGVAALLAPDRLRRRCSSSHAHRTPYQDSVPYRQFRCRSGASLSHSVNDLPHRAALRGVN
jgi:hypothetical protein